MKRIYLDFAATAPLRAVAREAMLPWLTHAHNPSSLHAEGRAARHALDTARDAFATCLQVKAREVIFTASGSESVSLALVGTARALGNSGRLITSPIEHRAVLAAADEVVSMGWEHVLLDVDHNGLIDLAQLDAVLTSAPKTQPQVLSLMLVNNEIGTVNDIAAAAGCARSHGAIVHCDAIGASALVPFAPLAQDVDLLSLAAHKLGGPVGAAVLIARARTPFHALIFGGGQEFGKRAGTENLAAIVGSAAALREVEYKRESDVQFVAGLRDRFEERVLRELVSVEVHAHGAVRAPGLTNIALPDLEIDILPAVLDLAGVAASAGSACASGALKRSHVLEAIGYRRGATMRFSWGGTSTEAETDEAAKRFIAAVLRVRTQAP